MRKWISQLTAPTNGRAQLFIRLAVGLIFATQGILKFTDPHLGVERFARIGFPWPDFTAHFAGTFEIVCGVLVAAGLGTRLASLPLLAIIATALGTTKIPELFRAGQGFWYMVSDARTDFAMLMSLVYLLAAGGGRWALEARLRQRPPTVTGERIPRNELPRIEPMSGSSRREEALTLHPFRWSLLASAATRLMGRNVTK